MEERDLSGLRALAAPGPSWRGLELPPSAVSTIRATLGAIISHAIGRRPRLLPYLGA